MQRLTAKELQRRYSAGERNFANVDLSGESLRGMNLKGIDLSGADLSRTDIRGTNFSEANLTGTQFVAAKAGTQRRWLVPQMLIVFAWSALTSFFVGMLWITFAFPIVELDGDLTGTVTGDVVFYTLWIVFILDCWAAVYTRGVIRGILVKLGIALGAIAVALASALAGAVTFALEAAEGVVCVFLVTIAHAVIYAFMGGACSIAFSIASAGAVAAYGVHDEVLVIRSEAVATATVLIGVLANAIGNALFVRREFSEDSGETIIRHFSVSVSPWGGTNFERANLTDASFQEAILESANLFRANLTRVNFHLSKKVFLSSLGKNILTYDSIQQNLLITLRGSGQSYVGLNLKDLYLAGADLADADFTEADLSNATLEGATLERANLTKTQALGTNFHQTILTGATLEAWNIDSTTNLDGAICDYVYLLRNQQERRPSSGSFAPGEFAKLFQEVLDTIDLIFQNGIDWKAFIQTFNQIQVQHADADLAVQSIENKGDGVVVVKLHAAPGADKPAIHQSFTEIYQLAFAEAEKTYKAQLHAKDEQITDYRQQNANMQEVIKLLAQRPINVDVKATAESKAMQGNDNSRTVTIGGNATNSIIQAGDGNIAELRHVTLPPPDRVNIQAELAALQAILAGLNDPVTTGIAAKLDAEAAKPAPDKSAIATTLETGLTYARNLQGFAEAIDQLRPHVQNAAGWLGEHGTKLLPLVGLVV